MLVIAEEMPFTIVWKVLVVVDRVLELMIELVADTPLVELVKTLPTDDKVLEVTAEVVAVTPLTVVVITLPVVVAVLVVEEASKLPALSIFSTPSESATTIVLVASPICSPSNLTGSFTPATCNRLVGAFVPIPTLPLLSILIL